MFSKSLLNVVACYSLYFEYARQFYDIIIKITTKVSFSDGKKLDSSCVESAAFGLLATDAYWYIIV